MRAPSDLAGTQRLISELVRMPESVEKTLELEGRSARFEALERTVNGDPGMPATRRLDVYANGYFFRILEALQEDYEGLEAALGEVAFHNLATAYLLKFPSSATSMRDVGARLPRFLESEPEAEEVRRCLAAGKTESETLTHNDSIRIATIQDELRRQLGVKFPQDD